MRAAFGLVGLLVVVLVVGLTARHQLQATRVPAPAAFAGSAPADGGIATVPLPAAPAGSAAKQYQADLRDAMQQAADQRGREADTDGGH